MTVKEIAMWMALVLGGMFGCAAAWVHGGIFEALTAASTSCLAIASALGWSNRAASSTSPAK